MIQYRVSTETYRSDRLFFFVCAFSFLLLSGLMYYTTPRVQSCLDIDSTGYDRLAVHFAQTGALVDPNAPTKAPVQTLGYPFLVGIMYWLFGHRYGPIIWLQILLMMLSVGLVMNITSSLLGSRVGRIAALLSVFNVGFLVYSQFLLAEAITVFLLLLFMQQFICFLQATTDHKKHMFLTTSGAILGCSILIKPVGLLLSFGMLGIIARQVRHTMRFKAILLFFVCVMTPVSLYMIRNKLQYGFFNIAPMMSLNMYHVFLTKVIAVVHDIPITQAEKIIPPFLGENTLDERGWDGARTLFYWYVHNHPMTCIVVWMQNVSKSAFGLFSTQLKLLFNPTIRGGDVSFFTTQGSFFQRIYHYAADGSRYQLVSCIALAEVVWSLVRLVLVGIGLFALYRRKSWVLLSFFLLYIANGLLITGFDGCGRYRIVVEPVLIIMAAYGLTLCWDVVTKKRIEA